MPTQQSSQAALRPKPQVSQTNAYGLGGASSSFGSGGSAIATSIMQSQSQQQQKAGSAFRTDRSSCFLDNDSNDAHQLRKRINDLELENKNLKERAPMST